MLIKHVSLLLGRYATSYLDHSRTVEGISLGVNRPPSAVDLSCVVVACCFCNSTVCGVSAVIVVEVRLICIVCVVVKRAEKSCGLCYVIVTSGRYRCRLNTFGELTVLIVVKKLGVCVLILEVLPLLVPRRNGIHSYLPRILACVACVIDIGREALTCICLKDGSLTASFLGIKLKLVLTHAVIVFKHKAYYGFARINSGSYVVGYVKTNNACTRGDNA